MPARNFKILFTSVGPFPKDRVVSEAEIGTPNVKRLVLLKAIEETEDDLTEEPIDPGPFMQDQNEVIPVTAKPVATATKLVTTEGPKLVIGVGVKK